MRAFHFFASIVTIFLSGASAGGLLGAGEPAGIDLPPAGGIPADPRSAPEAKAVLTRKLAAALRLKEERRLPDALRELEEIASASKEDSEKDLESSPKEGSGGGGPAPALLFPTAEGILAELEAIDVRLRMDRLAGVEGRLQRIEKAWGANAEIRRRIRALEGLFFLRGGTLLEPNAIARLDLGERFRKRFYADRDGGGTPLIPLDLPIRHMSRLSPGGRERGGARIPAVSMIGFIGIEDFSDQRFAALRPAFEAFDRDPRILLAFFVYTGDAEPPAPVAGEEPWNRAAVFWIRGTRESLLNAPVRSRYEWLPGPTIFLLDPVGKIASWKWPHEGWVGFSDDLQALLAGGPPTWAGQEKEKGTAGR